MTGVLCTVWGAQVYFNQLRKNTHSLAENDKKYTLSQLQEISLNNSFKSQKKDIKCSGKCIMSL